MRMLSAKRPAKLVLIGELINEREEWNRKNSLEELALAIYDSLGSIQQRNHLKPGESVFLNISEKQPSI